MSGYYQPTQDRIQNATGQHELRVILTTFNNSPASLDRIAFHGPCYVYQKASHWGNGESYLSEKINDPTWLDLCVSANTMLHYIEDQDHIFLEGAEVFDDHDGEKYIKLIMGS